VSEFRQILRGLLKRPGYASIVVLTLGLGIAATTTIYSVVDVLLVRTLPYRDADRLVVLGNTVPGQEWVATRDGLQRLTPMSLPNLNDLEGRTRGLLRAAALERSSWLLPDQGNGPEMIQVANATENFFELFAVTPRLGRLPRKSDYWSPGSPRWGALISYQSWRRRFGGDPNILGKRIDGAGSFGSFIIVGVLPPDFQQPVALVGSDVEFWMTLDPADRRYQQRLRRNLKVAARLEPGVTLERARAELTAAQGALVRDEPAGNLLPDGGPLGVGVNSLRDATVGNAGRPVLVFFGAALLLLVLAGTNAANLILVRGLEREGDLAVRRALGAGRRRLAAALVAESTSLGLTGGLVGLGLALAGVKLFHRFAPASLPRIAEVAVNPRIVLSGIVLSLLIGVGIGILPAVRLSGVDLLAGLRSSLHTVSPKGSRLRSALAATQLALALVLGIAASLLFRSFFELSTERLGFEPDRLVAFALPLKVERPWEAWDQVLAEVRTIPGVDAVAGASNLPFQTPNWTPRVERVDQSRETTNTGTPAYVVTPGFFAVAGVSVLRGRAFAASDRPDSRAVVIVNQTFARATFADRDPLGLRLRLLDDRDPGSELEIVGVVGDVVQGRVEEGMAPAVYLPYTQSAAGLNVLLRSERDAAALNGEIRRAVARTPFGSMPLREYSSLAERIALSRAGPRFQVGLIGAFAATALLLSAIGLYGTLAFTVRSRTRELGIRLALGADQRRISGLVIRQGLFVLGVGLAAGLPGAVALTRLLQSFLYRVGPLDPLAFLAAILVLAATVLLAALRPATRAARIDPMSSIRVEG
jgi:predicted permease